MGIAGRKMVEQSFSISANLDKWIKVVKEDK
jgi:hypothetical protein